MMFSMGNEEKRAAWKFVVIFILIAAAGGIFYKGYSMYQEQTMRQIVSKYAEEGPLIYGADDSAPPLRYVDRDGQYKGVVPDYIGLISIELGIDIRCVPYKWEDALDAVKTGKSDMIDVFVNADRSKYMVFTKPLYTLRTIMVTRRSRNYTLNDIDGLKVATQRGDFANGYLKEHYPNARLVYVHDVGKALELLIDGKVDGVIGDEPVTQYYAAELGIRDQIRTINTALYEEPVVIGVSKDKADLVKPLNYAIDKINRSGQPEKIQQLWFGISTPLLKTRSAATQIFRYLMVILLLASLAFGIKFIENRLLRRQVRLRTRELEDSRNELALMLNEMPEGVLVIDRKGLIQSTNAPAASFVKLAPEELQGMHYADYVKRLGTEQTEQIIEAVEKHETGTTLRADRGRTILECKLLELGTERKKDLMMTIEDTTVDVVKNNQLLQSSKMIAVGQLAAGMAHQLRNPLGIIRTHSYLLSHNLSIDHRGQRSLRYIDENVERASSIIDNVMNFWRIADTSISEICLKEFIDSIVVLNADEIRKKELTVEVDCDGTLSVKSSQESLKHVLMNLIQNAIEAVDEKSGRIIVRARRGNDRILLIDCEDNGCGIPKEEQEFLYNPFFTTKPPGEGTGLGLYIVYSEIERLGGEISLESAVGRGSVFHLRIPDGESPGQNTCGDRKEGAAV